MAWAYRLRNMKGVDLAVSDTEILIKSKHLARGNVLIKLDNVIVGSMASAKFKKASRKLIVKAPAVKK